MARLSKRGRIMRNFFIVNGEKWCNICIFFNLHNLLSFFFLLFCSFWRRWPSLMIKLVHWARKHSFQRRTWRRWATPFWGTCCRLHYYFLNNLKQVFFFLGACYKETSRSSLPYPLIKKFCQKAIFFFLWLSYIGNVHIMSLSIRPWCHIDYSTEYWGIIWCIALLTSVMVALFPFTFSFTCPTILHNDGIAVQIRIYICSEREMKCSTYIP